MWAGNELDDPPEPPEDSKSKTDELIVIPDQIFRWRLYEQILEDLGDEEMAREVCSEAKYRLAIDRSDPEKPRFVKKYYVRLG